ncbi:MAG: hypothetical protein HN657_04165 [Candidatus Marinimicrobia bacterium]|jgi:hypothetical protein|nr:hypothetical protein [Candidatus Neomarinimicrobiota bacterium]MBT3497190.1 hypothetical protein [Candidatus Neomarinimicrobiota bacterium]MBT3692910.1 hypothetical protein [Candidatus Neomarinimicrobiota bacterium]MBT3731650.1 hypothetical protein [Candidatus Neomarinimicrobiota bacterium]MBT4144404.1 hypothetical protein [Candidatus Neomarinimicrobiota bacterium]
MLSLKSFHIFFIVISIIVTAGYGVWQLQTLTVNSGFSTALGVLGILLGIGLTIYLQKVIRKFKTL